MAYLDSLTSIHKRSHQDYLARVNEYLKAKVSELAKNFHFDYRDGDCKVGYGCFSYDGRWQKDVDKMVEHYNLKTGDKVLEVIAV